MIPDKRKIAAAFAKAASTYAEGSAVQTAMAARLLDELPDPHPGSVLELGCGTGNLTALLLKRCAPHRLILNDLSPAMIACCQERFAGHPEITFLTADAETLTLPEQFSLIIANACFQWFSDLPAALRHLCTMLTPGGTLACTLFGDRQLEELRTLTGQDRRYPTARKVQGMLAALGAPFTCEEELRRVYYPTPLALLKNLRDTGVSQHSGQIWTRGRLNALISDYQRRYSEHGQVFASWHVFYVTIRRSASPAAAAP